MFLDSPAITKAVGVANVKALNRAGGRTRVTARRSIRYRKNRAITSPKGTPPYAHTKGRGIKTILYGYDRRTESVVAGFARLGGTADPDAPRTLEHGGTARIKIRRKKPKGKAKAGRRRTEAEKRRIREHYRSQASDTKTVTVRIDKRPTMVPTLEQVQRDLPELWRGEVKPQSRGFI